MKAAVYETFKGPITIRSVATPAPTADGVVLQVKATGVCRSDWHGWMGHDADIKLPHVPGHELSGVVAELGSKVSKWKVGDRVTVPFVCACGTCRQCQSGNHQVCDHQFQPGFTHWGSFAEYVAIEHADTNLVALPESVEFETAASLGCRFATSYRAIVMQSNISPGQWLAVHGCGGVGLSAIMIANAIGANVIAIDHAEDKLAFAQSLGAVALINAKSQANVVEAIKDISSGGVHVSIDALGSAQTCFNSVACLRKRGRHVQVGLMLDDDAHSPLPLDQVVANELEIVGSHGMQAYRYDEMLAMVVHNKLQPQKLIGKLIALEESPKELEDMSKFPGVGMTMINSF